jgi:uncharacterized protein (DUF2336 family)
LRQAFFVSADFRQLAIRGESGKAERLFRAAISAYCGLPRPARRDAAQLDDLALPLYDAISPTARRFAAATLSECDRVPAGLLRRLIHEPVELSAPLLIRSPAIADIDLVMLIGRHGLPHARAIARRPNLNPAIAGLLDAFRDPEIQRLRKSKPRPLLQAVPPAPPKQLQDRLQGAAAEEIRRRLRSMMLPANAVRPATGSEPAAGDELFRRLRETALSEHRPLFHTALADALATDLEAARALTREESYRELLAALASLRLGEEQAYLITAALFPNASAGAEAIRLFLYRYRLAAEQLPVHPASVANSDEDLIRKAS